MPLSAAALALLGKRGAATAPLFKVCGPSAFRSTLKALNGNGYTPHGFRTSLTEWAEQVAGYSKNLMERCIAHETRTKVRRAYKRSDLLEKRREVMQAWSDYVAG